MRTYIALIWDCRNRAEVAESDRLKTRIRQKLVDWRAALDQPGIFVSLAPSVGRAFDDVYTLACGRGVVLGKLFERTYVESDECAHQSPAPVVFDEPLSARTIADAGLTLRDKFWGTYLAFLTDSSRGRHWVLRDPMGQIPCQTLHLRGVTVYFANITDVERVDAIPLRVNKHFLIGSFVAPNLHSGETAYEGITTLLPGARVEHDHENIQHTFYWNAIEQSNAGIDLDTAEALATTRRVVRSSIHAWASCFDCIFLQLSGGLDSTIVAACLADAPTRPNVICVNFYSKYETSDERIFARETAARWRFELMEIADESQQIVDFEPRSRSVVPTAITSLGNGWREVLEALALRGANVHIRGDGGDELFYRGDDDLPDALDHAFRHGLTPSLWAISMNDAVIGRTSVWENLACAIRHGLLKRPFEWRRRCLTALRLKMLNPELRDRACADETYWHPLYRGSIACSPGKILQSHAILTYTNRFYQPFVHGNQLPILMPLLSQPHMEFSLRAPLYILRAGGRDRAVARGAFENEIPTRIANRKYKGLATQKSGDWVADHAPKVREMLLDGYLARERIVDRHVIETILARTPSGVASQSPDLMLILAIEVWAQSAGARNAIAA